MRSATDPPLADADPGAPAPAAWMHRLAASLSTASGFEAALRRVLDACLPALGDMGCLELVLEPGQRCRVAAAPHAPSAQPLLAQLPVVAGPEPQLLPALDQGVAAWPAETEAPDGWHDLGLRSMIAVPLRHRDVQLGTLLLFMASSQRRHTPADLALVQQLAQVVAPALENARLVERHRRAEEALRVSEERLRLAAEAGQFGIWDWDVVHDVLNWTRQARGARRAWRRSISGTLEQVERLVHPEDLPGLRESVRRALSDPREAVAAEFRILRADGAQRWLATRANALRDAAGRVLRMVGVTQDVTERAQLLAAERAARASAEQARRRLELLAAAGEALSGSLDPQATLHAIAFTVVPGIADWCRIDLLDGDGQLQRMITHHSDPVQARHGAELAERVRGAPETVGSMAWVTRSGQPYSAVYDSATLSRITDPAVRAFVQELRLRAVAIVPLIARGRTLGAMAAFQAESGRTLGADDEVLLAQFAQRAALALDNARLYAEAERARCEAETANRAKDEFLAMLGHELRNPLAPIVSALHLMSLRDGGAHLAERRVVERQVAHLSRLVDDLLDVSRITQGKVQLQRQWLDLRDVVRQALELTQPAYALRRAVEVALPPLPVPVLGDAVRLAQVVSNLLGNAAKFTPADARVRLRLVRRAFDAELVVEDEGIGVAPELLPRVFDLFVQGTQANDRRAGGLGLGLAIVRTLVQMHGGQVRAESAGPGQGSRFTVRLPLGEPAAPAPQAPVPADSVPPGGGRVLLVDDNHDAALTLAELLRLAGYQVRVEAHAAAALAAVEQFVPDLAVLDIGLPGIDGLELARRLRADPRLAALRLVALTGYGQESDRRAALQAGFDEHLVKPVPAAQLLQTLSRLGAGG